VVGAGEQVGSAGRGEGAGVSAAVRGGVAGAVHLGRNLWAEARGPDRRALDLTAVDLRRAGSGAARCTRKMVNVAVDSSIASRLTYMDFSEETRQRFTDVAEAMLSVRSSCSCARPNSTW
jgi:hypothetical protein